MPCLFFPIKKIKKKIKKIFSFRDHYYDPYQNDA